MLNSIALVLALVPSRADSVQHYYVLADVDGLRTLCLATDSREEDLLCRYRLYPLTLERKHIADLPAELEGGTPREKALLSGLWGYRASGGTIFNKMRCGRRAGRLMSEASEAAPNEPFVLLIEGQSLLFRPAVFGGDGRRALEAFRQLQRILSVEQHEGITAMEADLWVWFTLHRLDDPAAKAVRRSIESRNPPPLFAAFLENPPS